jgi:hypothetical protein
MPANPSPAKGTAMRSPPSMANDPALCGAIRGHLGNEMPAGAGGTQVGPATGLRQTFMPVAQRFTPQPGPAPFPARADGRIEVPGRSEDQPPRPPTTGSVYPRPKRDRHQLPNHTAAHRTPAKTHRK